MEAVVSELEATASLGWEGSQESAGVGVGEVGRVGEGLLRLQWAGYAVSHFHLCLRTNPCLPTDRSAVSRTKQVWYSEHGR